MSAASTGAPGPAFLERLASGGSLEEWEARELLELLTDPRVDGALKAGLLIALRTKGETADEVRGLATGMRERALPVPGLEESLAGRIHGPVDVVGTGGDGSSSFNLSTGSALLVAACGVPVLKHGNRSISSRSGSADVLEALGYPVPTTPDEALGSLRRTGFAFLFAPAFHPAMKSVGPVRRALGVRTVFNILGPLTNPARPPYSVIGAFSKDTARLMAHALAGMGGERAFVVHGEPGWDEATPIGPFHLFDVRDGAVREEVRDPWLAGIEACSEADLAGGDPTYNANALRDVFAGERGAHRDAVVIGAALALEVTGAAPDFETAIRAAEACLDDGSAARFLKELRA